MKIVFNPLFEEALFDILMYIAQDSVAASMTFEEELFGLLENLSLFPYKFRASHYYNDDKVRDCIFRGYTIPYLVDEPNGVIVILEIFKWIKR